MSLLAVKKLCEISGKDCPLGREDLPCVQDATCMVSRTFFSPSTMEIVLDCFGALRRTFLAAAILIWWNGGYLFEQPVSSLMPWHPRAEVLQRREQFALNQFLGSYGHWSAKLLTFTSNKTLGNTGFICI